MTNKTKRAAAALRIFCSGSLEAALEKIAVSVGVGAGTVTTTLVVGTVWNDEVLQVEVVTEVIVFDEEQLLVLLTGPAEVNDGGTIKATEVVEPAGIVLKATWGTVMV